MSSVVLTSDAFNSIRVEHIRVSGVPHANNQIPRSAIREAMLLALRAEVTVTLAVEDDVYTIDPEVLIAAAAYSSQKNRMRP